jgi:hypothetical protein
MLDITVQPIKWWTRAFAQKVTIVLKGATERTRVHQERLIIIQGDRLLMIVVNRVPLDGFVKELLIYCQKVGGFNKVL